MHITHRIERGDSIDCVIDLVPVFPYCVMKCIQHNSPDDSAALIDVSRKFGEVISLMSDKYTKISSLNSNNRAKDCECLFALSFIRCGISSIKHPFFEWIADLADDVIAIKDSKKKLNSLIMLLHTVERIIHNLRYDDEWCEATKEWQHFFNSIVDDMFVPMIEKLKSVTHSGGVAASNQLEKLHATILLHPKIHHMASNTKFKENMNISTLLQRLTNFRFKDKKNVNCFLLTILHFLRGGGSTCDGFIWDDNNTNIKLEQCYGNCAALRSISTMNCETIRDQIFRTNRKYDNGNMDGMCLFLLAACMTQLAVIDNDWTIKYIIVPFLTDGIRAVERIYVAVYVLNMIIISECGFEDFMVKFFPYQFSLSQFKLTLRKNCSHVLHLLCEFMNYEIPIHRYLLTMHDIGIESAIDTSTDTNYGNQEFFDTHVKKMLLFDWTVWPEKYYWEVFSFEKSRDMSVELLILYLRLVPYLSCYDKIWKSTQDVNDCGLDGHFIGKWLMHKDKRVRQTAFNTISEMMKDDENRKILMKGLVQMLHHHDWKTHQQCVVVLLIVICALMPKYKNAMIEFQLT